MTGSKKAHQSPSTQILGSWWQFDPEQLQPRLKVVLPRGRSEPAATRGRCRRGAAILQPSREAWSPTLSQGLGPARPGSHSK